MTRQSDKVTSLTRQSDKVASLTSHSFASWMMNRSAPEWKSQRSQKGSSPVKCESHDYQFRFPQDCSLWMDTIRPSPISNCFWRTRDTCMVSVRKNSQNCEYCIMKLWQLTTHFFYASSQLSPFLPALNSLLFFTGSQLIPFLPAHNITFLG